MAKEWTDDEVQSAIGDAVRIVREDKLEAFIRKSFGNQSDPQNPPPNPSNNPPPPNGAPGTPPKKKGGIWWGDSE